LEVLSTVQSASYSQIFIDNPASRSPPAA
jgi:hypothetical protein